MEYFVFYRKSAVDITILFAISLANVAELLCYIYIFYDRYDSK